MAHWTAAPSANRRAREKKQAEFERVHNETPEKCPCHSCVIQRLWKNTELMEQKLDVLQAFIKKLLEEQQSSPKNQPVGPSGDSSPKAEKQEPIAL